MREYCTLLATRLFHMAITPLKRLCFCLSLS